jgi:hypothetical protein
LNMLQHSLKYKHTLKEKQQHNKEKLWEKYTYTQKTRHYIKQ